MSALKAWNRFWFERESVATVVLVRVAFGVLMIAWTLSLLPTLFDFYSRTGILPDTPPYEGQAGLWTVFELLPSDGALIGAWIVLLLASICITIGLLPRLAALVVLLILLSLQHRNPYVYHSGDALLHVIAFYLVLAPLGAAVSVDRWRKHRDRFWQFPLHAPIALRLMQIQVSIIYVSTVWAKVRGENWNNGTAVVYSLSLDDLARFPVPGFVLESALLANIVTWAVLAIELGIGILVWNRQLRPYVLFLGVCMHLGIDLNLRVAFFSWAMFVLYLAFVPAERAESILHAVQRRLTGEQAWTDVRLPLRLGKRKVASTQSGGERT
jgi:hypothetical protein